MKEQAKILIADMFYDIAPTMVRNMTPEEYEHWVGEIGDTLAVRIDPTEGLNADQMHPLLPASGRRP